MSEDQFVSGLKKIEKRTELWLRLLTATNGLFHNKIRRGDLEAARHCEMVRRLGIEIIFRKYR